MNIFIAKEYDGTVMGLILAKDKDVALSFFEGRYEGVNSIEEIDINQLNEYQPYFNIISTSMVEPRYPYDKIRVINKR